MKLRINSRDLKYVIAFALVMTIISSGAAFRALYPPPDEQYFAMWILGPDGFAEHYYPHDDSNLRINEPLNWTIGVQNQMGNLEYVVIRVKLLNPTGSPISTQPILEFTRVLIQNETWSIPFDWMIVDASQKNESINIIGLSINGAQLNGQFASALSGYNFRFIFELWFYDASANGLIFSQPTTVGPRSVWTQVWFNATSVA
jgi:uncharacterized membrane protein